MQTTLAQLRAASPCTEGWRKLLRCVGEGFPMDAPISLITVLDSNGLDDALWVLQYAVPGHDKEKRLFAVWCVRQVQHLMADQRSLVALDVAEKFAHGLATIDQLAAARAAAWDAVWDAAWAAAGAAAWAAAGAARDAARAAAGAARDAAWAAGDAAWAAQEQELRRICSV